MFRCVYHFEPLAMRKAVTACTQPFETLDEASLVFDWLQEFVPTFTGGHIEQFVNGAVGWAVCDGDEVEELLCQSARINSLGQPS